MKGVGCEGGGEGDRRVWEKRRGRGLDMDDLLLLLISLKSLLFFSIFLVSLFYPHSPIYRRTPSYGLFASSVCGQP